MKFSTNTPMLSAALLLASTAAAFYAEVPVPYGKHHVVVTKTDQLVTIEEKTSKVTHVTYVTPPPEHGHKIPPYKKTIVDVICVKTVVRYNEIGPHAIPGYKGSGYKKDESHQKAEVHKCVNEKCEKHDEVRSYDPPKDTTSYDSREAGKVEVYSKPGRYIVTLWPSTVVSSYVHKPTTLVYKETTVVCKKAGWCTATLTKEACKTTNVTPHPGHPTTVHYTSSTKYTYHHKTTACHTSKKAPTHYTSHHPAPTHKSTKHTSTKHSTKHTTAKHTTAKHTTAKHTTTKHTTSKHTTTPKHSTTKCSTTLKHSTTPKHSTSTPKHSTSSKHDPTTSSHHVPTTSSQPHMPTTSSHHHKPTTTSHHHKPTSTSHHHKPTTTSHHHKPTTTSHHHKPTTTKHHHSKTHTMPNPSDDPHYEPYGYYMARDVETPAPAPGIAYRQLPENVVRRGGVLRSKRSEEEKRETPVHKRDFGIPKRGLL